MQISWGKVRCEGQSRRRDARDGRGGHAPDAPPARLARSGAGRAGSRLPQRGSGRLLIDRSRAGGPDRTTSRRPPSCHPSGHGGRLPPAPPVIRRERGHPGRTRGRPAWPRSQARMPELVRSVDVDGAVDVERLAADVAGRSETRNATAFAMSSGSPSRPAGIEARTAAPCGPSHIEADSSVWIRPGQIAFAVTAGARSRASPRIRPSIPALAAAYAVLLRPGTRRRSWRSSTRCR